jgi:hypothetical protein
MAKIIDEPIILRYEYDIEGNQIPVYSCKVETTITNQTNWLWNMIQKIMLIMMLMILILILLLADIRRDVNVIAPKLFTGAVIPKK